MDKKINKAARKLETINNVLYRDKDESEKKHNRIRHEITLAKKGELKADKWYDRKREKKLAMA